MRGESVPAKSDTEHIFGEGSFSYRIAEAWAKPPRGCALHSVSDVAVDRFDNVYAFNRGDRSMVVFDRNGDFLGSWGKGEFVRPHGLHIGPDDTIYCTDDNGHVVRKYTLEGKLLLEIGIPGQPAPAYSGRPFNRCTHSAVSPENDIYISDGYSNARVHKFSQDGKLIVSWGGSGIDPGEFNVPHNICCDESGWVYVADRENSRIQVFDGNGRYEGQWNNVHRPCGLYTDPSKHALCYVGELGPDARDNKEAPNLGPRLSVLTKEGKLLARIGRRKPVPDLDFFIPHGLAVDSRGDIYVADLAQQIWDTRWPRTPEPTGYQTVKKFVKV